MKILVVQDQLRSGGTERQSILLANAFAASGHATTLLTFRPGGTLTNTVSGNVTHLALQRFDTHLDWFAPGLLHRVAHLQPDVVLCMGRMANCRAGGLQRLLPNAAVIGTMRTGKPLPLLYRRSLKTVRHVVANSGEARETLVQRYAVPGERISVVHNALVFAAPASPEVREATRLQYGAGRNTLVLACVAMFRPEKNQQELVEIVSELPAALDWQLWLAGDGPARAACEALAKQNGLGARVKFPGWLADPARLYAGADVAVHASWSEALSNFLIEAQASGLPGVAYAAQGVAECFLPENTGWVIPRDDRRAFRDRLLALAVEPPQARAARSRNARSHAMEAFDRDRQVGRYLELFERLLATRASGHVS